MAAEVARASEGYLVVRLSTLATLGLIERWDRSSRRSLVAALSTAGLICDELSGDAKLDGDQFVVIRGASVVAPPMIGPAIVERPVVADPAPRALLDERAAEVQTGSVLAGASSAAVALMLVVGWWPAVLLGVVVVAAVWQLFRIRRLLLARAFWLPSGRAWAGLWMGAAPALLVAVLCAALLLPWKAAVAGARDRDAAAALAAQAGSALDAGARDEARRLLDDAARLAPDAPGVGEQQAALANADERAEQQAEDESVYTEAIELAKAGKRARALALFRSIPGVRDASSRAGKLATSLVTGHMSSARSALAAGQWQRALAAARAANDVRPSRAANGVIARAQAGQRAARRAAAAERARRQAAAREAAARRAAERRAAEQAPQPLAGGAGDGGGDYSGMTCPEIGHSFPVEPGSDPVHDRDNDGIACESQ